ncbi:D-serine deaminase-like pyridoxal phosphate-dependent protein [Brevibacterium sanguinis]|uniref:D-serine deaminase-like pyridoxal phosphate-dependent protein n=2 Tax=Brevibacterium TaxID=1696 RepID=A0A366IMC4_9MICO|nr:MULTISPECIES: amino acid deaminase/aldolase [Brevibacterium]RBP67117.1 D-serine deaminase-like pyridoxal phosphate-dependent protein [Brevibacterium sanguinis]RBP73642.1 D-serine deaminase-like pyridoxal phosphate-dependent protein [Brevibacterium celere]
MVNRELRHALRGVDGPVAVIDRDAFDANARALSERAGGLPIRVASKSLRVLAAIERALAAPGFSGVLAYSLPEALMLVERGIRDIVVAYPSVDRSALRRLLASVEARQTITLMIDSTRHLELIAEVRREDGSESGHAADGAAGRADGARAGDAVRICIDIDASYRLGEGLLGDRLHIGARRSPIRDAESAVALARHVVDRPGFDLVGLMSYEGQIAGTADAGRSPARAAVRRLQTLSARELTVRRKDIVARVREVADLEFVNGGGTGSLESSAAEGTLTEVAAGSGLFAPGLFDGYAHFRHRPAAYFATPVVRRPGPGWVTVFKGGLIASGVPGPDRLPTIAWPPGLDYAVLEGAGEVQTPLRGPGAEDLGIGDLVWFRHAKAGELAEHFGQFLVVSGAGIAERWTTYRGHGWVL